MSMNLTQKTAFDAEITQALTLFATDKIQQGFLHLERAHVIGQMDVVSHVMVHWLMFKAELRRKQMIAAFGQVIRILLGALGSALGRVPVGNTGGSNVSMFKRMPIDPELKNIIEGRAQN